MTRRNGTRKHLAWITIACGLALSAAPAVAQDAPLREGFGAVRVPAELVSGRLAMKARRAWVWRVAEPTGPETIRIVLDGDVETAVGPNALRARRAAFWLRPIGVGGVGDAAGIYEVFGYLEDVESPGGPASYGLSAERLPIEAVIAATEPVRLIVDSRRAGPPSDSPDNESFESRAARAFTDAMEAIEFPERAASQREEKAESLRPPAWIIDRRRPGQAPPSEPAPVREGDEPTGEASADQPDTTEPPSEPGASPGPGTGTTAARPGARAIPFTPQRDPGDRFPGDRYAGEPPPGRRPLATPGDERRTADPGESVPRDPDAPGRDRIFSSDGVFFFSAGDSIAIERGEDANALTLLGGVVIQHEGTDRRVEMVAERGVIFLEPGPLDQTLSGADVKDVRGIYLEGGVRVTDGEYTLRSPRVFYDTRADRAVLIDAVFRTYDDRLRMPLYMRAEVIRQEAANRFTAEKATYANTAFAEPHLSIGTTRMTIEDRPEAESEGGPRRIVEARGVKLRAGGVPFFWWPWYKGDPEQFPLRTLGFSDNNRTGTQFRTGWDPFTLLGIERPRGFDAVVDLDYYTDRGFATGGRANWRRDTMWGDVRGYYIPDDNGKDVLRNGTTVDRDGDSRGFVALRHVWRFQPEWDLLLNGFYASDAQLLPALFREIGENDEEYTTRAYLRRLEDNSFLTIEAKGATTDFIPNEHLAQSPGYMVDKLPEIDFGSIGADPFADLLPPPHMHTWNASLSRMRMRFQEIDPADIGLRRASVSQRVFGVDPNQPIADSFRARGLDEDFVTRVDTRQEIAAKFNAGPLVVNPFVVGRFTGYDTDFDTFSAGEADEFRLWGAAGVNLSTSIFRIDDDAESRVFDIHRMRHIIEPSVTLWHAGTTVDEADLPVYDDDVESLIEGSAIRAGINQTWQTKRGAPGRWRTVDVFTLDLEYVWFSDDVLERSPVGRFYSARPELSAADEFIRAAGTWQISEVFAIGGETIWDVEDQREDRNSLGVDIRHSEDLRSRVEFRQLESQDAVFGNGRVSGTFGDKYTYVLASTYNFREQDFQRFAILLFRDFPVGRIGGSLIYNNLTGETSFGLMIQPTGARSVGLDQNSGLFGG